MSAETISNSQIDISQDIPRTYIKDQDKAEVMAYAEVPERELSLAARRVGKHAVQVIQETGSYDVPIKKRKINKLTGVTIVDRALSLAEMGDGKHSEKVFLADSLAERKNAQDIALAASSSASRHLFKAKEAGEAAGKAYNGGAFLGEQIDSIK